MQNKIWLAFMAFIAVINVINTTWAILDNNWGKAAFFMLLLIVNCISFAMVYAVSHDY